MSQRPLFMTGHSPSYWRVTIDSPPLKPKETQAAFLQARSAPAAQQRAAAAFALGLQTPGDFERDLGRRVVERS